MTDHGISLNKHCPCVQKFCPIRGNCVLCVQNHLQHRRHLPECFQNILRDNITELAEKMELDPKEARPDDSFWKEKAKNDFLTESLARHDKTKRTD